jgi:dGTPase
MRLLQESLYTYRKEREQAEEQTLYRHAAFSKDHYRLKGKEDDHRLPYKRDVDRIVHSKAYGRYMDKTQVAYLVENDHITYRSLHVQLVSHFARGIGEILALNLDLIEAISLGHDVGHPPFGHEGEEYLSELSIEYTGRAFAHSYQSCRLLRDIEPLNLGLAVYDGFLCHDGGMSTPRYAPQFGKTEEDHFRELEQKCADPDRNIWPATLEGCLVKLCDTCSYLGRDIEDGIRMGVITREQVPQTLLGVSNREILSTLACDIITKSHGQDFIEMSQEVFDALKILRSFNFRSIYLHPRLKVESPKIKRCYRLLFEILIDDFEKHQEDSELWRYFLHNKSQEYLSSSTLPQRVIDYIAGMTDNYFIRSIERLILPQKIKL